MLPKKLFFLVFLAVFSGACSSLRGTCLNMCLAPLPDIRNEVDARLNLDDIRVLPHASPLPGKDGIRDVRLRWDTHGQSYLLFKFDYRNIGFSLLERLREGRIIGPRVEIRDRQGRLLGSSFLVFGHLRTTERVERVIKKKVIESGGLRIVLPEHTDIKKPHKTRNDNPVFLNNLDKPIEQPVAIWDKRLANTLTERGKYVILTIKMLLIERKYLRDCAFSEGKCSFLPEEFRSSISDIQEYYIKQTLRGKYKFSSAEQKHLEKLEKQAKEIREKMRTQTREYKGIEVYLQKIYLSSSPQFFRIVPNPKQDTTYREDETPPDGLSDKAVGSGRTGYFAK